MTKVTISYKSLDRKQADEKALRDAEEYLGEKAWAALMYEMGVAQGMGTSEAFQQVNIALDFCGVSGYPVHALGRKYMPRAYRAWMEGGADPVKLDDELFPIAKSE